jgi:hypothetical protein
MLVGNLATVCAGAVTSVATSLLMNRFSSLVSHQWIPGLVFLSVLSLSFNFFYKLRQRSASFAELLIGGIVLRFLFSLVFLLVMWLLLRSDFFALAIHFLTHYFWFSVVEIRYLSAIGRNRN